MKLEYIENNKTQEKIDLSKGILKIKEIDENSFIEIMKQYADVGNRVSLLRGNSVGIKLYCNEKCLEVKHFSENGMYKLVIKINNDDILDIIDSKMIKISSIDGCDIFNKFNNFIIKKNE